MIDPRLERVFQLREARDLETDATARAAAENALRTAIEELLAQIGLSEMSWREFVH